MAALSSLYPYIVPDLPRAPEPAIDRALVDAAIEFCQETLIWQETGDPVPLIAGVTEYEISPSVQADPYRVLTVVHSTNRITLGRGRLSVIDLLDIGDPLEFVQTAPGTIVLSAIPETAGQLVFRYALTPRRNATTLDDELVRAWRDPITAAAREKLHRTYGDPVQGQLDREVSERFKARAVAQHEVGLHRGRLRTTPVR